MKFLTFYHPIPKFNIEIQCSILDLIIKSWNDKGFEVVVANYKDAMEHPLYEELLNSINTISLKTTKAKLDSFFETSIIRWLAWATKIKNEEVAMVGDYDVFNNNLSVDKAMSFSKSNLTFWNNHCLCLGSGTKKGFENWAEIIIKYIGEAEEDLKELKYDNDKVRGFHDQDLMEIISSKIDLTKNFDFEFIDLDRMVRNYDNSMNMNNTKLECVHFSHRSSRTYLEKKHGPDWRKRFAPIIEQHRLESILNFIDNE